MTTHEPDGANRESPPLRDAANTLADDVRALVRTELTTAWQELRTAGTRGAVAAALFGGAAALGLSAAHAGSTMLLRLLESTMPKPAAAATLAAVYAGAGCGLAMAGRRALESARRSAARAAQEADHSLHEGV